MVNIQVDTSSMVALLKKLHGDGERFKKEVKDSLQRIQDQFHRNVLAITPVDTGYMKSRWRKEKVVVKVENQQKIWIGKVKNDTYYLPYVNYGHRTKNRGFVNGRWFIEGALFSLRPSLKGGYKK